MEAIVEEDVSFHSACSQRRSKADETRIEDSQRSYTYMDSPSREKFHPLSMLESEYSAIQGSSQVDLMRTLSHPPRNLQMNSTEYSDPPMNSTDVVNPHNLQSVNLTPAYDSNLSLMDSESGYQTGNCLTQSDTSNGLNAARNNGSGFTSSDTQSRFPPIEESEESQAAHGMSVDLTRSNDPSIDGMDTGSINVPSNVNPEEYAEILKSWSSFLPQESSTPTKVQN